MVPGNIHHSMHHSESTSFGATRTSRCEGSENLLSPSLWYGRFCLEPRSTIVDVDNTCAALDFIYKGHQANLAHRDVEFWNHSIVSAGGLPNNKTAELDAGISTRAVMTMDPENIKALLTGQFADYGKGEPFHRDWKEFLGDSIFATDGELWSRSRQLIRPMFARERIVDTEIFEKHVQKLIPLLGGSKSPSGGRVVDVGSLFFRYTLDAATDYLLGQGTDSLENPATRFAEAFRYVQQRQAEIFRFG